MTGWSTVKPRAVQVPGLRRRGLTRASGPHGPPVRTSTVSAAINRGKLAPATCLILESAVRVVRFIQVPPRGGRRVAYRQTSVLALSGRGAAAVCHVNPRPQDPGGGQRLRHEGSAVRTLPCGQRCGAGTSAAGANALYLSGGTAPPVTTPRRESTFGVNGALAHGSLRSIALARPKTQGHPKALSVVALSVCAWAIEVPWSARSHSMRNAGHLMHGGALLALYLSSGI